MGKQMLFRVEKALSGVKISLVKVRHYAQKILENKPKMGKILENHEKSNLLSFISKHQIKHVL